MVRKFMHASQAFDRMISSCEKLAVPRSFKENLVHRLNYFKTQSLCDRDRKHDEKLIRERWAEFESETRGCGLFEQARLDHAIWPEIISFIGVSDPKYVPEKKWEAPARKFEPPRSPFEKWTAEDFFRHLKSKISSSHDVPKNEKQFLKIAVCYLFVETMIPRSNRGRDPATIKETWKLAWPLLNKYGFLDEYRKDTQLKSRVEFFLKDGF
ncbi:MAG: hypothetical protein AB7K68_15175 [Bacteriovoracia bacterium]